MSTSRILLAEDHGLVADALRSLLEKDYELVGVATDGRQLCELARDLNPDVILSDIFMPSLNGLDAARLILKERPAARIVLVTMNPDPDLAVCAFRAGAAGYLLKSSAGAELKECLRAVLAGENYLTRLVAEGSVVELLKGREGKPPGPELSVREKEVLQLLAEGKSMKQVSAVLAISTRTVQYHKYRIMERFQLKSGAELVQFALRKQIIS
jgi:DNA-binding NarL/FixJ family response regulator